MNREMLESTVKFCIEKVDKGMETLGKLYPESASINNVYSAIENRNWTTGFWTGMLWLAYEFTGSKKYKDLALWQVDDFYNRIENKIEVGHHDMGFLYMPSCVAAYRLTGYEKAKEAAIMAAETLVDRFQENGQFIQAWGELGTKENYRLIIDCLLNIPLLFWATKITGDKKFEEIAFAHLNTSLDVVIREDGSTFHTYYFDPKTGAPLYGKTRQGYSDDSIWTRGQAWGIYGIAIAYKYTKRLDLIEKFKKVTDVFISHLPEDDIPAWDMIFTDTKTVKDTSSSAIAVCGILEMNKHWSVPKEYLKKSEDMMNALYNECLTSDIKESNGILKHGTYSYPDDIGVDECNIWGDFYFMEALMRNLDEDWVSYWE